MARITDTKTTKKYAKITFEFEHNGAIHSRVSKLKADDYWLMSDRVLKNHIRARANHERNKIDTARKTPKKEEQEDSGSNKSESENLEPMEEGTQNKALESGLEQQSDLEKEQDQ